MSRAEAEIAAMTVALENYKADNGDYPLGTNVNGSNAPTSNGFLLASLMPGTGKVYFEFNKSMMNSSNIVDPFGENYGYQYPGRIEPERHEFFRSFFAVRFVGSQPLEGELVICPAVERHRPGFNSRWLRARWERSPCQMRSATSLAGHP